MSSSQSTSNWQNVSSTSTKSGFFYYGASNPNPFINVQVGWYVQGGSANPLSNIQITRVTNVSGGCAIEVADPNIFGSGESYYFTSTVIDPTCFKEDSKIVCLINDNEIEVPVQDIQLGDLVKTYVHGYKKVVMKGTSKMENQNNDERVKHRLYKYTSENYPEITEELVITGEHSILVDKLSEKEEEGALQFWKRVHLTDDKYRLPAFVDEKSIPYEQSGTFNIYHIALEHNDDTKNYGIYANGLLLESCCLYNLKNKKGMTLVK
jgi:hypothetical protein